MDIISSEQLCMAGVCKLLKQLDTRIFIIAETVVLLWFSVARFGVRVSVGFHLTCIHINF